MSSDSPHLKLGIPHSSVNISIILAIVLALILFIILNKTTFGYELKATGFNKFASAYAGMNDKRNIVLTMVIAGAMAGLGGAFAILTKPITKCCPMWQPWLFSPLPPKNPGPLKQQAYPMIKG